MRLAYCIRGEGEALKTGKVYEVSETYHCAGEAFVDVPSAPNWHVISHVCEKCGHDRHVSWFARRFIPINDADVTDDAKRDEKITA